MKYLYLIVIIAFLGFKPGDTNTSFPKHALPSNNSSPQDDSKTLFDNYIQKIYTKCKLHDFGVDFEVFKKGMIGYYNIRKNHFIDKHIVTLIDFQKPSTDERLWIIDVKNNKVLEHTLVAHGKNTGNNLAVNFSNTPNSNMSSLGFYITKNTYVGKHGLSLVIQGLDKNYNSNAESRSVVIHGADYVSPEFIKCNGRLGRSQGCPALPMAVHKEIINTIGYGSVIFISHPSNTYKSEYLNQDVAIQEYLKDNI